MKYIALICCICISSHTLYAQNGLKIENTDYYYKSSGLVGKMITVPMTVDKKDSAFTLTMMRPVGMHGASMENGPVRYTSKSSKRYGLLDSTGVYFVSGDYWLAYHTELDKIIIFDYDVNKTTLTENDIKIIRVLGKDREEMKGFTYSTDELKKYIVELEAKVAENIALFEQRAREKVEQERLEAAKARKAPEGTVKSTKYLQIVRDHWSKVEVLAVWTYKNEHWKVQNDDYGLISNKWTTLYVAVKRDDGKCYLIEGRLKRDYEGGGNYGEIYPVSFKEDLMDCDTVNK